jgi:hypothetical protein
MTTILLTAAGVIAAEGHSRKHHRRVVPAPRQRKYEFYTFRQRFKDCRG